MSSPALPLSPVLSFPSALTRIHVSSTESTNGLARAHALDGAAHLTLVTADSQSDGRGRGGRSWASPRGNLYSSLVLRPGAEWPDITTLPHVAALAIHDCISALLPDRRDICLKWPNDILVAGEKISGALLEGEGIGIAAPAAAAPGRTSAEFLIMGIGVNVTVCPDIPGGPSVTSLAQAGARLPERHECTLAGATLMRALLLRLDRWIEGGGFVALKPDYLGASVPAGTPLSIRVARAGDQFLEGRFAGVNDLGHLCLETSTGPATFVSGDLIHAGAARPK